MSQRPVPENIGDAATEYRAGLHAYSVQFGIPEDDVPGVLAGIIGENLARDGIRATGAAWSLGELSWRERSIATVTAMMSMGGVENRLGAHLRWAVANGITVDELETLMRFLVAYIGMPKVTVAMEQLQAIKAEQAATDD